MPKNDFKHKIDALQESIARNEKDGFVPLMTDRSILGAFSAMVSSVSTGYDAKSLSGTNRDDELNAGKFAITAGKLFGEPKVTVVTKDEPDLPGNGAVGWGTRNDLPAYIYKTAKTLPYTAQGLEYQANASVGIKAMFVYQYATISNGVITKHECDFHLAGQLLISEIREIRRRIKEEEEEKSAQEQNVTQQPSKGNVIVVDGQQEQKSSEPLSYRTKPEPYVPEVPLAEVEDSELDSLQRELDNKVAEYRKWYQADIELRNFEKNNDLSKLFNDLAQDDIALDLNFPLIGLEQGTKEQWAAKDWFPKIVKVGFSPAVISRFELKGEDNRSHYVYANEKWRYHLSVRRNIVANTIPYPLIRWMNFHDDLDNYIEEQKKKKNGNGWYCWYAVPNKHLSNEMEYYTFPAWWSIYPSLAFLYATTLMLDKSIARQNDIAWRRIIYVDRGYLEDLYAQDEDGQDKKRQEEIRKELEMKVNNFLSNKANNGKTLMVDSTISEDGKTLVNSIRVETIPETSQKTTEDEIHAISSVLFYAQGLDPRLVGAVPGKQNSSSGTQARELELLNIKKLTTRRERIKRFMLNIAYHNGWCPEHVGVTIQDLSLSTLDRSNTGMVETNN